MKNELISVVVPVYNIEKYLDKCIESLKNQTYKNLEIILVDDGATDNSGRICDLHARGDDRIFVLHQKNGGRAAARNAGMERATGEYLMFVDGDDWIDTDCIEEAYKFFENDTEMVVFRERSIYADRVEGNGTDRYAKFVGNEPLEFYVNGYSDFQAATSVCGKLYRRNLVQDICFEEGRYYEDIMFVTKVYAACHNCIYLDKAYYNYNVATDNSITAKGAIEVTFRDEIPLFHEKEVFLNKMGREDLSVRFSYLKYQRLIRYYTECVQAKKREYVKRLVGIIKAEEDSIRKMIKMEYVSRYYRTYLLIFLRSPKMAYIFGNLFEKFVKLRNIVRSLGKSGG
ncbi:MAG: glycosyltransferase [Butyrivibrio sp.]|nr:glycosyltransferase [Butyrivibrio sp.]